MTPFNTTILGTNRVNGETGANMTYVPPGTEAILMDESGPFFYFKKADIYGRAFPLRKFRFEEITGQDQAQQAPMSQQTPPQNNGAYEDLVKRVTALEAALMPKKEAPANEPAV